MIREQGHVNYGRHSFEFTVLRRKRTTLEIGVETDGTVTVVAPIGATLEAISEKVRKRASWVRQQQHFFLQFVPRTPSRRYVPGETHLYLGRQYRLKVTEGNTSMVKLWRGFLIVQSKNPKRADVTREILNSWYLDRARVKFAERLEICLSRFRSPENFRPKGLIIRQLHRRWGSMSAGRRMVLNRGLIQAPVDSIDYVITHELCHVAQPHHEPAFFRLLDRILPNWERRKQRLECVLA